MNIYLENPEAPTISGGMGRLGIVAQMMTREEDETAARIAAAYGCSRQALYLWIAIAAEALEPRSPGPAPAWREEEKLRKEVAQLRRENAELRARVSAQDEQMACMIEVTGRRRDQLELVCFSHNVPLRGTQEIIQVAWGEKWRPGRDSLQHRMKERGRVALDLLGEARAQVAPKLSCVMGDDVYFHRCGVKVVAEPESMAMLNVGRWQGSSGLDWVVWLEEYSHLNLLVSDLGKDLVGAATQLELAHSADYFHEMQWFNRKVLWPLSRWEERSRERYWNALDGATRPSGPGRRLSEQKVIAAEEEADARQEVFLAVVEVVDMLRKLYEPVNPATGRLWTRTEVDVVIDKMIARLDTFDNQAARRVRKHLRSNRARYAAYLVMFDTIDVQLHPSCAWSKRTVLNGLIRLWETHSQLNDPAEWVDYANFKDRQRLARELERRLRRACPNLDAVARELRRQLWYPKRSSSGVESLNSKLRVLQMVHRNVSDEMLGLVALSWNLKPREHRGKRRGRSPYEMLGVDIGQGDKPWYDVLLDAQDQHKAAA